MSSSKAKLQESAQKNFLKGAYDKAVAEYRQLIQLEPGDMRHRQKIAEILTKANQKESAITEYTSLAKSYLDSQHYLKAIAVYKQIQKLDPENPQICLTLATINQKQGIIGNVINELTIAVQIFEKNGESMKALETLHKMKEVDPANSAVRLRIAEKYHAVGVDDKSLEEFRQLLFELRERADETGFNLILARAVTLFGDQAKQIETDLEGIDKDVVANIVSVDDSSDKVDPAIEPSAGLKNAAQLSPVLPVEDDEIINVSDDDLEEVEELLPLEEEEPKCQPETLLTDEWEEDIEIDFSQTDDTSLLINQADTVTAHEIDLTELELDLEMELEFEPEETVNDSTTRQTGSLLDDFDLGKELASFADEINFDLFRTEETNTVFDVSKDSGLKKNELTNEDAESHYSLGLAYREMGLYDDAITEFIVSAHSEARHIDSLILQSGCYREMGDIVRALDLLKSTLENEQTTEDERLGILYEIAVCHEDTGSTPEALAALRQIMEIRNNFSDTSRRIARLESC